MKKIVIVTFLENVAEFYMNQIIKTFNEKMDFEIIALKGKHVDKTIVADLVLISTPYIFKLVKEFIDDNCVILFPNMTISKEGKEILNSIPKGTTALLVNNYEDSAIGTISLLYQMGYRDFNLIPYFPGVKLDEKYKIAITPNEVHLVPRDIETIYNIGDRIFDVTTIVDIATILGFEKFLCDFEKIAEDYQIASTSLGFEKVMLKSMRIEGQLEVLFNYMSEGIIGINNFEQVSLMNKSAYRLLNVKKEETIGFHYNKVWTNLPFKDVFKKRDSVVNMLIKREGITYVVNIYPVINNKLVSGALCIFKSYLESERTQNKLREQVAGKGHKASYSFDDIVGVSDEIINIKNRAKNMAKSEASIIIYGESGTGKELFAQSIHNESNRKKGPFVAINCAALSEQLLESELFGYEEGAFTGAKKGGKQGLFEIAHGGTLFLDEIGEMPMRLQSKLLRVIQERKVMHLGGEYLINIDVRIIAATNRDLRKMTINNTFRKDLFYRLNVLYLIVSPLRKRLEDIPIIIDNILNNMNRKLNFSNDVLSALKQYSWEGNVRELYNCIEYFCYLGKSNINISDLPDYVCEELQNNIEYFGNIDEEIKYNLNDEEFEILILSKIYEAYKKRKRIGRNRIYKDLSQDGYIISENKIRDYLYKLKCKGLVKVLNGRAGTIITNEGIKQITGLIVKD